MIPLFSFFRYITPCNPAQVRNEVGKWMLIRINKSSPKIKTAKISHYLLLLIFGSAGQAWIGKGPYITGTVININQIPPINFCSDSLIFHNFNYKLTGPVFVFGSIQYQEQYWPWPLEHERVEYCHHKTTYFFIAWSWGRNQTWEEEMVMRWRK